MPPVIGVAGVRPRTATTASTQRHTRVLPPPAAASLGVQLLVAVDEREVRLGGDVGLAAVPLEKLLRCDGWGQSGGLTVRVCSCPRLAGCACCTALCTHVHQILN